MTDQPKRRPVRLRPVKESDPLIRQHIETTHDLDERGELYEPTEPTEPTEPPEVPPSDDEDPIEDDDEPSAREGHDPHPGVPDEQ